jgi:outer membrane receptor protein involved in Fe transport
MIIRRIAFLAIFFFCVLSRAQAQEIENVFNLKEVIVTAQGREERLLEVPITMSSISSDFLELTNVVHLQDFSNYVPGLHIRIQTPHRPTFVIRGLTSDEVSPTAQPRVSTYFNNAPISRASMAKSALFDMERIEVVKGPQGTLFGRGAQIGGINFITQKPTSELGGFVGAGIGNYGMKEVEGVLNIPVVTQKLMIRAGGSYAYRDGYVKNLSGGKELGDLNSTNGRFSLRYLPTNNFRIDLLVDYQNDSDNGTPFMSKRFPNSKGVSDIFDLEVSLDPDKKFFNKRSLLGTMLDMNYYINDRSHFTSLTSFHHNKADSRWDGDGMIAPLVDMTERIAANQFTQELRYNFTMNRLNGFVGGSFWREEVEQKYGFSPNEQYLAYLFLQMADYMIQPDGHIYPMPSLPPDPQLGPLAGLPLPSEREEMKVTSATNSSFDLFADLSYRLTSHLVLTAGIRGTRERMAVTDKVETQNGGTPSTLGMLSGAYPNTLYALTHKDTTATYLSATWRAGLKYLLSDRATLYAGYSKGRRPNVLQSNSQGGLDEMNAEKVDNFDIGFKYRREGKLWFDIGLFYYHYRNFQAYTFDNMLYVVIDAGKAKSYGAEMNLHLTTCDFLDLFGNYAYIRARFDNDPANSIFAGNRFRLTPDHSFTLGLNAKAKISRNIGVVFTPTYSYRDKVWFEDDNTPDLTQGGYGLLNLNLAFRLQKPSLHLSLFCHNVTGEKYLISAGNTGTMFGVPTFVPGLPTTFGMKVRWSF